jgi:hypothetical protein
MMMVLALVAFSAPAMAQDPMCGALSAADCEVLTQAQAAQAGLTSATFDFTLDIAVGAQTVPLTGDGSFAIDPAVMAELAAVDPTALSSDPTAALTLAGNALKAIDLTLNVNAMGIPLNLLMVDGIGYLNFETLAPMLGGAGAGVPTGWAGLDLSGAIEMMGPMLSGMDMSQLDSAQVDPAQQQALTNAVMQHVEIARSADVDGEAVFTSTFDFGGLLQDEAFLDTIMSQATSGQELTEEQLAQVNSMMAAMSEGINLSFTQTIDLTTHYTTGISFDFDLDGATLTAAAASMGETSAPVEDISFSLDLNLADFNAAPAVTAPAGAPVSTIMDLMGAMGGMGGM